MKFPRALHILAEYRRMTLQRFEEAHARLDLGEMRAANKDLVKLSTLQIKTALKGSGENEG